MAEPEAGGDEFDKPKITGCRFVVPGRQTPRVFHLIEASLDEVPQSVDEIINGLRIFAVLARRNDRSPATSLNIVADHIETSSPALPSCLMRDVLDLSSRNQTAISRVYSFHRS